MSILLAAAAAAASPCQGFYSYIPDDRDAAVAFSVEVQPTALVVSFADYGRIFAERQDRDDGIIQIHDSGTNGTNYWLACSGNDAFFVADGDQYNPVARVWRLIPTQGDIWEEAERRGWQIAH